MHAPRRVRFMEKKMQKQFDMFMLEAPDVLAVHWEWPVALGVIVAILGLVAIWKATAATILYVRLLGLLALIGAAMVIGFSFTLSGYWTEFFVHVLWAMLIGLVGLILLLRPAASAEAITLMVAVYFLISGIMTMSFAIAGHVDNLWIYVTEGLINLGLGVLLLAGWPITGLWAIGTFLGVDLLFKGSAIVALGLSLRAISA
jgi:uncharacterized membrane protein HdeD (DUF308 family)